MFAQAKNRVVPRNVMLRPSTVVGERSFLFLAESGSACFRRRILFFGGFCMKTALENIGKAAAEALQSCSDPKELDAIRVRFLGKKGELTAILKQMGKL